jgi:hypothetical protein
MPRSLRRLALAVALAIRQSRLERTRLSCLPACCPTPRRQPSDVPGNVKFSDIHFTPDGTLGVYQLRLKPSELVGMR